MMTADRLTLVEITERYRNIDIDKLIELVLSPGIVDWYDIVALPGQTVLGTDKHRSLVQHYRHTNPVKAPVNFS